MKSSIKPFVCALAALLEAACPSLAEDLFRPGELSLLTIHPVYTNSKASFGLATRGIDENGLQDNTLRWGWNVDSRVTNEPSLFEQIEHHYRNPLWWDLMEWHLTYYPTNGAGVQQREIRPVMVQIDRKSSVIDGKLTGNWNFGSTNGAAPLRIYTQPNRDNWPDAVVVGEQNAEGPKGPLDVFSSSRPGTLSIGGLARSSNNVAAVEFYAQNGPKAPVYARVSLGVHDGAAGSESGEVYVWSRGYGGDLVARSIIGVVKEAAHGEVEMLKIILPVGRASSGLIRWGANSQGNDARAFSGEASWTVANQNGQLIEGVMSLPPLIVTPADVLKEGDPFHFELNGEVASLWLDLPTDEPWEVVYSIENLSQRNVWVP